MAALVALAAAAGLPGCGTPVRLETVRVEPPAGAEFYAETDGSERGGRASRPIYRFDVREGEPLSYRVMVRNVSDGAVTVTGARTDLDMGPFAGQEVLEAPVTIAPGEEAGLTIRGRIEGCAYDGQLQELPEPNLVVRSADGEESTQFVTTDVRLEYVSPEQEDCR